MTIDVLDKKGRFRLHRLDVLLVWTVPSP